MTKLKENGEKVKVLIFHLFLGFTETDLQKKKIITNVRKCLTCWGNYVANNGWWCFFENELIPLPKYIISILFKFWYWNNEYIYSI